MITIMMMIRLMTWDGGGAKESESFLSYISGDLVVFKRRENERIFSKIYVFSLFQFKYFFLIRFYFFFSHTTKPFVKDFNY